MNVRVVGAIHKRVSGADGEHEVTRTAITNGKIIQSVFDLEIAYEFFIERNGRFFREICRGRVVRKVESELVVCGGNGIGFKFGNVDIGIF